jgi:hypothetical protein
MPYISRGRVVEAVVPALSLDRFSLKSRKRNLENLYTPLLFCRVVCIWKTEVRYGYKGCASRTTQKVPVVRGGGEHRAEEAPSGSAMRGTDRWIKLYSDFASQWKRWDAVRTPCSDTYSMIDSTVVGSKVRLDPEPGRLTPCFFKNRQQAALS